MLRRPRSHEMRPANLAPDAIVARFVPNFARGAPTAFDSEADDLDESDIAYFLVKGSNTETASRGDDVTVALPPDWTSREIGVASP